MKLILTLILAISLQLNFVKGQYNLSLSQLEQLADCEKFSSFDSKARKLGYSFDEKIVEKNITTYDYSRSVSNRYYSGKLSLTYMDYGDGKPLIFFGGSSTFIDNQIENLKNQIEYSNPKYYEFNDQCEAKGNALAFCFQNSKYRIMMFDEPLKADDQSRYNYYKIKIFRRP